MADRSQGSLFPVLLGPEGTVAFVAKEDKHGATPEARLGNRLDRATGPVKEQLLHSAGCSAARLRCASSSTGSARLISCLRRALVGGAARQAGVSAPCLPTLRTAWMFTVLFFHGSFSLILSEKREFAQRALLFNVAVGSIVDPLRRFRWIVTIR